MRQEHALVVGIDIGTSGVKAVAVAQTGQVIATSTSHYDMSVPEAGWAEQNPADWWLATVSAVRTLMAGLQYPYGPACVQGISFSGQMHGLVPLDSDGKVIRPSIIWCDLRSAAQAEHLERDIGRQQIIEWTQNPPLPNFTLTKLLWVREHEPEAYARIQTVLLPKDYVRYQMTGHFHMDVADASGTLLFDVARRCWSREMCHATGIPLEWLPDTKESNEVSGHITRAASELLGVPEGTPVVVGAGDQAAGAIGLGVMEPGTVSAVFGTSGVVLTPTKRPVLDPRGSLHTFCHAVRDRWFVMGVTQSAGGSLQWYRNRFAQTEQSVADRIGKDVYSLLMAEASRVSPGSGGLLYLPYLMGERTPHLDPHARGAWIGLEWRHDHTHLVRSVLEGVSFSLRDCWMQIQSLGAEASRWCVSGGGAEGQVWMDIFASVLGHPVEVRKGAHGPAFGAAILAAQGVGLLGLDTASVALWTGSGEIVEPRPEWTTHYERLYPLYQKAYASLRELYQELSRVEHH